MRHSAFSLIPAPLSPFSMALPIPVRPLLVDRSFSSEQQGQQLIVRYHDGLIHHR
jgi:hypothetical protein